MNLKIGLIGAEGRMGKAVALLHPVFPITRSTSRIDLDCDVLIDFSSPHALKDNLSAGKPIVIGTTGHLDFSLIEQTAKYLPIFYAPNFSIGAAILNRIAAFVSMHFPSDIDLIETHHSGKKDSPSGTALHLAKNLPNCRIHSIRSGKTIGKHTLVFNNGEEELTLSHQVQSREAFAKGALAAAQFLIGKPPGLYNMDNLFI